MQQSGSPSVSQQATRRLASLAAGILAAGFFAMSPVPANAGVLSAIGHYFRDRALDLMDVVRIRYIVPDRAEGYGVKARATCLAQAGFVHVEGDAYGMDRRAFGWNAERRTEGGVSVFYGSRTQMEQRWGNQYLDPESRWNRVEPRGIVRNMPNWDDGRLHPMSVGAEVQLGIFGLDLGVYPTEAIDFVTGWLFFDVYNDDQTWVDSLPFYGPPPIEAGDDPLSIAKPPEPAPAPVPSDDETTPSFKAAAEPGMTEPTNLGAMGDPVLGSSLIRADDIAAFRGNGAPDVRQVETPLAPSAPAQGPATKPPSAPPPPPPPADAPAAPEAAPPSDSKDQPDPAEAPQGPM